MTVFRLTLALLERPLHPFHSGGCRGTVGTRRWGENYKLVQKRKSGKWRKYNWIFLWGQTGLLKSMGDARRNQTYRRRVTSDEETPVLVGPASFGRVVISPVSHLGNKIRCYFSLWISQRLQSPAAKWDSAVLYFSISIFCSFIRPHYNISEGSVVLKRR